MATVNGSSAHGRPDEGTGGIHSGAGSGHTGTGNVRPPSGGGTDVNVRPDDNFGGPPSQGGGSQGGGSTSSAADVIAQQEAERRAAEEAARKAKEEADRNQRKQDEQQRRQQQQEKSRKQRESQKTKTETKPVTEEKRQQAKRPAEVETTPRVERTEEPQAVATTEEQTASESVPKRQDNWILLPSGSYIAPPSHVREGVRPSLLQAEAMSEEPARTSQERSESSAVVQPQPQAVEEQIVEEAPLQDARPAMTSPAPTTPSPERAVAPVQRPGELVEEAVNRQEEPLFYEDIRREPEAQAEPEPTPEPEPEPEPIVNESEDFMPEVEAQPAVPQNFEPERVAREAQAEWETIQNQADEDFASIEAEDSLNGKVDEVAKEEQNEREKGVWDKRAKKRLKSIADIKAWIQAGFFRIEGDTWTKKGKFEGHDEDVEAAIQETLAFVGAQDNAKNRKMVFQSVMVKLGLTPDTFYRMFRNENVEETEISKAVFIHALADMRMNCKNPYIGQPFAWTNQNLNLYGSIRFGLVPTNELAAWWGAGRDGSQVMVTGEQIMQYCTDQWKDVVYPSLCLNGSQAQKAALLDAVDAIEEINGTKEKLSGRTGNPWVDGDANVGDLYGLNDDLIDRYAEHDKDEMHRANKWAMDAASAAVRRDAHLNRQVFYDKDGFPIFTEDVHESPFSQFISSSMNFVRGIALINPFLFVGGVIQHAQLNIETKISNLILRKVFEGKDMAQGLRKAGATKVSREMYDLFTSDAITDALQDAMGMCAMGNHDGLRRFLNNPKNTLGKGKGSQFKLNELKGLSRQDSLLKLYNDGSRKFFGLAARLSSGQFVMRKSDSRRFIEALWFGIQRSGVQMTEQEFLGLFKSDDPRRVLGEFLKRPEGWDALHIAMNNSLMDTSVATEAIHNVMAKHGVNQFVMSVFFTKFPEFMARFYGNQMPFSITMNYILAMNKARGERMSDKGKVRDRRSEELAYFGATNAAQADNGMNPETGEIAGNWVLNEGLAMCLILDATKLGTRGVFTFLMYSAIGALGFEPPDDEEKQGVWGEWKVAGVPVKSVWWLNDIFGWMLPLATSVHVAQQTGNAQAGFSHFVNGMVEVMGTNPWTVYSGVYETITQIYDWMVVQPAERQERQQLADAGLTNERNTDAPSNWGEAASVYFNTWALKMTASFLEVPFLNMLYTDAGWAGAPNYANSKTQIYTLDPNDSPDQTTTTTWADEQYRRVTSNHFIAADFMNFVTGFKDDNDGVQKTGYRREEMPLVILNDPIQTASAKKYSINNDMTDDEKMAVCDLVIDELCRYDSAEQAAQNGMTIDYESRNWIAAYIDNTLIDGIYARQRADFAEVGGEFLGNGLSNDENYIRKQQRKAQDSAEVSYWYQVKDRLFDTTIPYSPTKYYMDESEWRTSYTWKDGGGPASYIDYVMQPGKVSAEMFHAGTHKTQMFPFIWVDDPYDTWDFQTPCAWAGDLTDMEDIRERFSGQDASGMFAGIDAYELVSGSGNSEIPLTGMRGLTPIPVDYEAQEKEKEAVDTEGISAWDPLGYKAENDAYLASLENGNGSGYYSSYPRTYSRSSGGYRGYRKSSGSTYNPKIYSNPAYNLNADRPATMYSKRAYDTNFDYLRPGFETKGSREAYKRSDI